MVNLRLFSHRRIVNKVLKEESLKKDQNGKVRSA
jgi:hypothetical protein